MLEIENLTVYFGDRCVLDNVSLSVKRGEVLGIVGESGSGKTMTVLSVMGLLNPVARITGGSIRLDGREIIGLDWRAMSQIRGRDIAMIFQEPMTSLNPTMRIGKQLGEAVKLHYGKNSRDIDKKDSDGNTDCVGAGGVKSGAGKSGIKLSRQDIKKRVLDALADVRLSEPERVYNSYPHELSGGMRQRVMIAMGTICRPGYLLCDEPTTALDVTTQKGILELIDCMKKEHDMGIVFITHDLKLLKNFADKVAVMCQGKVVERGTVEEIFASPKEEYTKRLIAAIPDRSRRVAGNGDEYGKYS